MTAAWAAAMILIMTVGIMTVGIMVEGVSIRPLMITSTHRAMAVAPVVHTTVALVLVVVELVVVVMVVLMLLRTGYAVWSGSMRAPCTAAAAVFLMVHPTGVARQAEPNTGAGGVGVAGAADVVVPWTGQQTAGAARSVGTWKGWVGMR